MAIFYPALSTVQLAPSFTGSRSLYSYLSEINDEQSVLTTGVSAAPVEFTRNFAISAGTTYKTIVCTIRNPYDIVFTDWLHVNKFLTAKGVPTVAFDSFILNRDATGIWSQPLSASPTADKGCWTYFTPTSGSPLIGVSRGQITDQLAVAGIDLANVNFVRLESLSASVTGLSTVIPGIVNNWAYRMNIYTDRYHHININNLSWKAAYTSQVLADVVYKAYQADFTAFGYSKDSWKS